MTDNTRFVDCDTIRARQNIRARRAHDSTIRGQPLASLSTPCSTDYRTRGKQDGRDER